MQNYDKKFSSLLKAKQQASGRWVLNQGLPHSRALPSLTMEFLHYLQGIFYRPNCSKDF
jgi:hypothetical protein